MQFAKPPLRIPDQIDTLKQRGLTFKDEEKAAHYLSNISYYRLRAYTYPFQDNTKENHPFNRKISFEEIIDLYVFDRKLRLLTFDALEKIEISLRTKIIYEYAVSYGSHWYEDQNLYRNPGRFNKDVNKLYEEIDRSTESWMHSFAHLRNICAHHGRLWNRRLTTIPQLPNNPVYPFLNNINFYQNKLYGVLSCISYILRIINPQHTFNNRLKELLKSCVYVNLKDMGFPKDWEKEPLWQD